MTRQYDDPWDRHGGGYRPCRRITGDEPCPCVPGGCDDTAPAPDEEEAPR